jgi:hypothetical protein
MMKFVSRLLVKAQLWIFRTSEVARFDGIILADLRSPERQTPHFRAIILGALRLLKETDPCRFARVKRRLKWIVRQTLDLRGSAQYQHSTRTCAIDFLEPSEVYDSEFLTGWYASTLVHEATHGEIRSRGILYTEQLRQRIEQICVKEQQNFEKRLTTTQPDLAKRIHCDFDAANWEWSWSLTPWQQLKFGMRRIYSEAKGNSQEAED